MGGKARAGRGANILGLLGNGRQLDVELVGALSLLLDLPLERGAGGEEELGEQAHTDQGDPSHTGDERSDGSPVSLHVGCEDIQMPTDGAHHVV